MRDCMREGGKGARGGGARCAHAPGLPDLVLEETARQQHAGARQPRDKAQVECDAGVLLQKIAAHGGRDSHVRQDRDVVGIKILLEEENSVDARYGTPNGHLERL